jgi:hypothetical protein
MHLLHPVLKPAYVMQREYNCVRGRFFITLQECIFTLLNLPQRLKELVLFNFSTS